MKQDHTLNTNLPGLNSFQAGKFSFKKRIGNLVYNVLIPYNNKKKQTFMNFLFQGPIFALLLGILLA